MSKLILKKELILLDFKKDDFRFYNVEVLSVGYNQIQVITTYGSLGNKGRENIQRFEGDENVYKEAMKLAYRKIYEKKSEGFVSKEKIQKTFTDFLNEERKARKKKKPNQFSCDLCNKAIKETIYRKIDEWARGEGNWDKDTSFVGYKKVLCLDCQIEHDVFKKKIGHEAEKKQDK